MPYTVQLILSWTNASNVKAEKSFALIYPKSVQDNK